MAADRTQNHRPLRGGIAVWPSTGPGARGTLTAVARRIGFDTKVLVTNIHVVSTSADNYTLTEGEYLYQGGTGSSDRIGKTFTYTDGANSWLPVVSSGRHQDGQEYRNPGDIALLDVKNGVTTDFGLHVDDGSGGHEQRPIVFPPVDPLRNMKVQVFGSVTGPGEARITVADGPNEARRITVVNSETEEKLYYRFKETVVLSRVPHPGQKGDSGAPCVWEDEDGNYRLVCILYAGIETRNHETQKLESLTGYAMPARLAESLLGIYFGVSAPTAEAGDSITVNAGEMFCLNGENSRVNEPNAGPLEYSWERYISTPRPTGPLVGPQMFTREPTKEFTAPPVPSEAYLYQLTVKDANGAKHSDLVRVIVNTPPVAKPGINRVVPVHTPPSLTPAVTLLGAAEDPDAGHVGDMRYSWRVDSAPGSSARSATTGPTVALSDANVARPTFTPTAIGDYVFTLTVRDPGDLTHSANVTIHACPANETSDWFDTGEARVVDGVLEKKQTRWHSGVAEYQWVTVNHPPMAFAGYNDIVLPNTTVYLRGSSEDPDRHPATEMTYNWSLVEDVTETPGRSTTRVPQGTPLITIASPTSRRTSFTAPAQAQTLRIRLTVTDPNGATDTDDVITQVHSGVGTTEWLDTRATRGCGATRDKEQMRRIDRRPHGEYRWTADPEDEVWSAWEDTDQTRNRNEGDWTDTDPLETMGEPPDVEKKQTRIITWEKEQTRTSETCGTIEPQWLEASETETRWFPVTPPTDPPVVPPKPTDDQWNVRRSTDGIYANVVSLPTVSPAISEVQVRLQIDTTTVTATLGTTLDNSYDKVLADDSSNWQTGEWSVSIRFKNSQGYGPYSDAKTVLIANWVPTGRTRNRTEGNWEDTGRTQTDPVEDFDEKEQRRLITYDEEHELQPNPNNEPNRWFLYREFKYRWVRIQDPPPPPLPTTTTIPFKQNVPKQQ